MKNSYILIFILLWITCSSVAYGQVGDQFIKGKVSFLTSKSVYVKFDDTSTLTIGDTLTLSKNKLACLIVTNKSTTSVVCSVINDCKIEKDDVVYFTPVLNKPGPENKPVENEIKIVTDEIEEKKKESIYSQYINGRASLSSYSTLSNTRDDRHRLMGRFSLTADHINDSKFSFDSYLNYRKNFITGNDSLYGPDSYFRVYSLSVKYDATPDLSFVIGRNINPKMSSVGAMDGLQVEKYFGTNYIGVIAGFRPDIFDFNFNSDLLQYGAYFGKIFDSRYFYSQTTAGLIEQRNRDQIDRRYAYLQHTSTIFSKVNLFGSAELDIYNKINGVSTGGVRLTNLYASARYRFNRNFNLTLSYDSRKRIIYYETFQTEVERMLDDDIARQGFRARVNVMPMEHVSMGFGYSKRFQSDNQNKSDNINGYFGLTKIPGIGGQLSVNFNVNSSNYLESSILSLRHSRTLIKNTLEADFYYRHV
ncbi:MAG: hypothetical protein KDC56_00285, partial [Flavobacteriaceae bacterium]|nr:hypothetical protein [Flavobacteriaceae bacterium]